MPESLGPGRCGLCRTPCPSHLLHPGVLLSSQPVIGKSGVPQGPSEQKVAVVTVDDCDAAVALKFGQVLGNYSCSAQGTQSGTKK